GDQALAADFTLDGAAAGTTGASISNHIATPVTNHTTGESGHLLLIRVNGVDTGIASTIQLSPGDARTTRGTTVYQPGYDDLTGPVCFAAGTPILTAGGPRPVECLRAGDLIVTRDRGAQPLRWVGRASMAARGAAAPVAIAAGAL